MKKLFVLMLALVFAFSLTMPAMAFTSDTDEGEDYPYDLSIYLVDYDDNDLFGFASLPESDRGYAKNEIVAAVVELYVPDEEDPYDDDFTLLEITGDNVDFEVADEPMLGKDAPPLTSDDEDGWHYTLVNNALQGEDTYQWLIFAKVTDDEASITVKLISGYAGEEFTDASVSSIDITLNGNDYEVWKYFIDGEGGSYEIWDDTSPGNGIIIYVDEDYKSEGMRIGAGKYMRYFDLGVNTDNELGILDGAKVLTSGDEYDEVMDIYQDNAVDDFGLDYFRIGNYVRDSFFENLQSSDTIVATVDIEPWTAYVTVPDDIIVDPPKTGDAASIMGFAMVALSCAGAVVLKKRG